MGILEWMLGARLEQLAKEQPTVRAEVQSRELGQEVLSLGVFIACQEQRLFPDSSYLQSACTHFSNDQTI